MRLSLRYLQKFIKQKNYIFEDRSSLRKELAKTYVVFFTAGGVLTYFMTFVPGRHICDCQARKHELLRNCLSCGRVVCAQEGSGPCFTCGTLVCSKEEQEILDRGSKKSQQLREQLMSREGATPNLANAATGLSQALAYRDKLLLADADSERRTRVNDLEADYVNMESSPYLTPEEREAILQRKAELRQMRMSHRQRIVVDFDFAAGKISERAEQPIETARDPVLQSILQQSQMRMRTEKEKLQTPFPKKKLLSLDEFKPEYSSKLSTLENLKSVATPMVEGLFGEDDEAFYAEIEQKGYCLALDQPLASFVVSGLRKHLPIWEDVRFTVYQTGAIMGRVFVEDCLTWKEYNENFPGKKAEFTPKSGFVILVSRPEALEAPVPHIPPGEFYQVNSNLRKAVKSALDPYHLG
ncbi:hypothetical protein FO519_007976 [Halicephalobus sp. NKZ332]|nr:hypothetical protein FO519_007976 [Halicephalobus sp. NKZ332]